MQITGMLHGAPLLGHVDFPAADVLGPDATEEQIQALIDRHGLIFIKPVFRGGIGGGSTLVYVRFPQHSSHQHPLIWSIKAVVRS